MPPRRSPSPLLSSPLLIILFPIIISIILFYAIPQFLSLTSQLLRPTISVKKSWDSLNVLLVIFAILCGVFAKLNDDASSSEEDRIPDTNIPHPLDNIRANRANISESESAASLLPQQWFGYSDRRTPESGGDRLRRSSSSYPDLRPLGQDSVWETRDHNKSQFHFFDDFEIGDYRRVPPVSHQRRPKEYSDVIKEIPVDTFVLHSSPPLPSKPSTPPPPPPPPPRNPKPRRTYQTVGRRDQKTEKVVNKNVINEAEELEKVRTPPPTPPRPVAPPSPIRIRSESKRRKSNVKKEIAMVWASVLSNQRKRKKQHKVTGTRNIYETAASLPEHEQQDREGEYFFTRQPPSPPPPPPPSPPPPPPPPPPPHSVFHNLFKKGMSKTKKVHSVLTPPTPPPPPPPPQPALRKHKSWNTSFPLAPPTPPKQPPPATSRPRHSPSSGRPPLPTKANSYLYDGKVNSGCQSPLIPVAPAPPPSFKTPELKFFVRGDFVKIQSAQSSRCGSPELEDVDDVYASPRKEEDMKSKSEVQSKVNAMDGGSGSSVFCPSPDVNTKADNFIARLKDEWRLEKMNSMRQKMKMP